MDEEFESLFKPGPDLHNNACLNFMQDMSVGYIDGYKMAADELAKKIHETGVNQDYLVYPIVFLYRQHLELILKSVIKSARQLLRTEEQGHPTHHKLKDLWPLAKELRKKYGMKNTHQNFNLLIMLLMSSLIMIQTQWLFAIPKTSKVRNQMKSLGI